MAQSVKTLTAVQERWTWTPAREDALESPGKGNGNPLQYSSLENSTEELGRLQSIGSQKVRHDWVTNNPGANESTHHWLSHYYGLGTSQNTQQELTHLILTTTLWGREVKPLVQGTEPELTLITIQAASTSWTRLLSSWHEVALFFAWSSIISNWQYTLQNAASFPGEKETTSLEAGPGKYTAWVRPTMPFINTAPWCQAPECRLQVSIQRAAFQVTSGPEDPSRELGNSGKPVEPECRMGDSKSHGFSERKPGLEPEPPRCQLHVLSVL